MMVYIKILVYPDLSRFIVFRRVYSGTFSKTFLLSRAPEAQPFRMIHAGLTAFYFFPVVVRRQRSHERSYLAGIRRDGIVWICRSRGHPWPSRGCRE